MNTCCRSQTTPFCPVCGADLEAKSLVGLKKYLTARLKSATKRLKLWTEDVSTPEIDQEKVKQGIARGTDSVVQLESWLVELDKVARANEDSVGQAAG